jgi:amidase
MVPGNAPQRDSNRIPDGTNTIGLRAAMTLSVKEYVRSDATALARLVRSGEVSAAELLNLAKAQLDRLNPTLNAVNLPMLREAEQRVAGPLGGALAGVPLLIKDAIQDYAGLPTSNGSPA